MLDYHSGYIVSASWKTKLYAIFGFINTSKSLVKLHWSLGSMSFVLVGKERNNCTEWSKGMGLFYLTFCRVSFHLLMKCQMNLYLAAWDQLWVLIFIWMGVHACVFKLLVALVELADKCPNIFLDVRIGHSSVMSHMVKLVSWFKWSMLFTIHLTVFLENLSSLNNIFVESQMFVKIYKTLWKVQESPVILIKRGYTTGNFPENTF